MKKAIYFLLLCLAMFTGCSCRKKPCDTTPPVNYDPRNVSRNSTISANSFIAIDGSGTVHIVWRDVVNGLEQIFYSYKNIGQGWATPANISNSTLNASAPQIAVDPAGGLHVVWDELGTSNQPTMYTNKTSGGSWVIPIDLSSASSPSGALPQIGIDDVGKAYVVFMGGGTTVGMLFTVREVNGLWALPVVFSPPSASANPVLAVSNDGQMHVLYERTDHQIMYMHRSAGGVWDSAVDVSRMPGQYCSISNIIVDNAGNVYAAWTDRTAREVYFTIKAVGDTAWSQPLNVSNSAVGSWIPKMAVSSDGTLHYIWAEDISPGVGDIYYKKRLTTGEWTSSVNVSNNSSDSRPNCLKQYNGKIYFSWSEWPEGEIYFDNYPK